MKNNAENTMNRHKICIFIASRQLLFMCAHGIMINSRSLQAGHKHTHVHTFKNIIRQSKRLY
jgi:hypothetical protein